MKPSLLRVAAFTAALVLGLASFLVLSILRTDEVILRVEDAPSLECFKIESCERGVVISVPADDEFYLGKRKVALSEVTLGVIKLFANRPTCARILHIKYAAHVRFETLERVARELRPLELDHIHFLLDKKKRAN